MYKDVLRGVAAAAVAIGVMVPAWAAARPNVDVLCSPTDKKLIYLCIFRVTAEHGRQPIEDAEFTITTNAPDMPEAASGVSSKPGRTERPGIYSGTVEIGKLGEWAMQLDFSKPMRDTVVKKVTFGPLGATAD